MFIRRLPNSLTSKRLFSTQVSDFKMILTNVRTTKVPESKIISDFSNLFKTKKVDK